MSSPYGNSFAALDAAAADVLVDTFADRDADGFQRMATLLTPEGLGTYTAPELIGSLTQLERESALVDEVADLTVWEVKRGALPDRLFPLSGRETVTLPSRPGVTYSVDVSRCEMRGEMYRIALVRNAATGMKTMRRQSS